MRKNGLSFVLAAGLTVASLSLTAGDLPVAATPAENTAGWVLPRVSSAARDIAANENRHFNVVMVGDSITECWKYGKGGPTRKKLLGDFSILNLGISGDTTRNVLWRFDQGFLDGYTADVFQIMIGTNNGGADTPEDVRAGVAEIIRRIRGKHPESKILLLPIFHMASPQATALRKARNEKLVTLADGENVLWHDFNRRFYGVDGKIPKEVLYDGQHPNVRAHEIWAEEVRPIFARIVKAAAAKRKTVTVELASGGDVRAAVAEIVAKRAPGDRGEIVLGDGVYELSGTVELDAKASFVTIRAKNRGRATIVGGRAFRGADFTPVTDAAILKRLPAAARGRAVELTPPAELAAAFANGRHTGQGQWTYPDWNRYKPSKGRSGFEYPTFPCLTVDLKRRELARWPNGREWCWLTASNLVHKAKDGRNTRVRTGTGRERGWDFADQKIAAAGWIDAWRYRNNCTAVTGRDETDGSLVLENANLNTDFARTYFFNVPEEMDEPGEWCYDGRSGKVLLYPPEGFCAGSVCAIGSTTDVLFHVTGEGCAIRGINFTAKVFHPAVVIEGDAAGNEIRGCRFSGVGYDCIWMSGRRNSVRDCDFEDVVSNGVAVQGGNPKTMLPALNWVDNNRFTHCEILCTTWAKGAIYADGVGNRVSHNVISDQVDGGIYFAGFDQLVEYNRVYDVCGEFDDVGVVYSPGVFRGYGCVFRYNDLSGAPGQVEVLYYDDCTSGHEAYGNVLRSGGENVVLVGGGRDNYLHDNVLVGGFTAIGLDNRGLWWPGHVSTPDAKKREAFARDWNVTNRTAAIRRRYPRLYDWYTNDVPFSSYAGNRFERNVIVDPSGFASALVIGKGAAIDPEYVAFTNNLLVRTAGAAKGRDLVLHPDEVATNEYSATVPLREAIGECRVLDGTPERPVDLGFVDNPGPAFDPWAYFGYPQQSWVERPKLYAQRREGFRALGVKPWRKGDFNLKPGARLLKELPGFKPIPWNDIGLYRTEWRTDAEDRAAVGVGRQVTSPDGRVSACLSADGTGPTVTAGFDGRPLFTMAAGVSDGEYQVLTSAVRSVDSKWTPVWGTRSGYPERYGELTVRLSRKGGVSPVAVVTVRAYDEGVAVRVRQLTEVYGLNAVGRERTAWTFPPGTAAWGIRTTEGTFGADPVPLTEMAAADAEWRMPLTMRLPNGTYASVLEADVRDYPRSWITVDAGGTLRTKFALGVKEGRGWIETPWRAVLVGRTAGELVERAFLVENLNAAPRAADWSWVRPGLAFSDIGNCGNLLTEEMIRAGEAVAAAGGRYLQIDWGWYGTEYAWSDGDRETFRRGHPELAELLKDGAWERNTLADPRRVARGFVPYHPFWPYDCHRRRVDFDMTRVIAALRERGVGLCLYLHGEVLENNDLDELFALYESWGVVGLKPGFVGYGSQRSTDFLRRLAETAARHHLWLDVHDEHIPDGFERTFPNVMITEGGGGQEGGHPVRQDLVLPFTRCLAGPFDYTPEFFPKNRTHAHMAAMLLVYPGPTAVIRGSARDLPTADPAVAEFVRALPWNYDDTRVLAAEIGRELVVARRREGIWYVAGLSGERARETTLKLDFLDGEKDYELILAEDASADFKAPSRKSVRTVRRGETVSVRMAASGGFAGRLVKTN